MSFPMPMLSSFISLYVVGSGCCIGLFSGGSASSFVGANAATATFSGVSAFQPALRQSASSFRAGRRHRRASPLRREDATADRPIVQLQLTCRRSERRRAGTELFFHLSTLARYQTAESEADASSSLAVDGGGPNDDDEQRPPITLVPVSRHPVMLRTSSPLLAPDECDAVAAYFDHITGGCGEASATPGVPSEQVELGARLLNRVRSAIDSLTGSPSHSGEAPLPRYVAYNPEEAPPFGTGWGGPTRENLLPDGLHVDTNNSRHFRHMTVLLYLSTNDGIGATTFPLATPLPLSTSSGEGAEEGDERKGSDEMDKLVECAAELIKRDVQHTQAHLHSDDEDLPVRAMTSLEDAALDLLYTNQILSGDASALASYGAGIRVTPQAGHACVFLNLDGEGYPDPLTFHGGEALLDLRGEGKRKKVLTFFKEVPVEEFGSREEFAERVNERREYILGRYF